MKIVAVVGLFGIGAWYLARLFKPTKQNEDDGSGWDGIEPSDYHHSDS